MRYKIVYFLISLTAIGAGAYGLLKWGLLLGVDFKGGVLLEYKLKGEISSEGALKKIEEKDIKVSSIQTIGEKNYLVRLPSIGEEGREVIRGIFQEESGGEVDELRYEEVGATFGPELIKKTALAVLIASSVILFWVAYQFRSLKFGLAAVLAMLHDSFILVGSFALFGHFVGAEVDFLFVTALLTTLSFSVHDTIVVFDRIREVRKKEGGELITTVNKALTETMVRSLNNSLTIIFMLVSLILLGGRSIRWFGVALLLGTISGTYSSPFVAAPLLVTWEKVSERIRSIKK